MARFRVYNLITLGPLKVSSLESRAADQKLFRNIQNRILDIRRITIKRDRWIIEDQFYKYKDKQEAFKNTVSTIAVGKAR